MQKSILNKASLNIILPLFLGVLIYTFFTGNRFIGLRHWDPTASAQIKVPIWVKNNLPDGLWMYALLSFLFYIHEQKMTKHFLAWMLLAIVMSFFLEILQAIHIMPGTFDWYDLLAYLVATFVFFLTKFNQIKQITHK